MSRWAAHFVIVGETIYRMHCLEIASSGDLQEIFPLTEEIAGTSFLDGVLLAVTASSVLTEKRSPNCYGVKRYLNTLCCYPIYSNNHLWPLHLEKRFDYFTSNFIRSRRLNSAQTTAVAIATLSDSAVSLYDG